MESWPISFKSFAKINLNLFVGPPVTGGLHALSSLFQTISLHDTVTISPAQTTTVTIDNPDIPTVNTVSRAVAALAPRLRQAWSISVTKRIPLGAGLGGGSSNAATVLLALNACENLGLPPSELRVLGAGIGSDVPFFTQGGHARVSGTGDRVAATPPVVPSPYIVLITSDTHCSTQAVYRAYDALGHYDCLDTLSPTQQDSIGPNSLQKAVMQQYPDLNALCTRIHTVIKPRSVWLTGSGSTLYVPCTSAADQDAICAAIAPHLDRNHHQLIPVECVWDTVSQFNCIAP